MQGANIAYFVLRSQSELRNTKYAITQDPTKSRRAQINLPGDDNLLVVLLLATIPVIYKVTTNFWRSHEYHSPGFALD